MMSSDRLRVCFLIRSLERGGAERQLLEITAGLDPHEFDVTVLTFYDGGAFLPEFTSRGIRVVSLQKGGRWDLILFFLRLVRELRRRRPHVLHGCLVIANEISLVASRLLRIPVVWWLGAAYVDLRLYDWLSRLSFRVSALLSRFPELVIINSVAGRSYHVEQGYAGDRMIVVSNGFDTDTFRPDPDARSRIRRAWGLGDGERLIGLVARIDPIKDHRTFVDAAAILAATDRHVRFVCIGDGPEATVAELRDHADALGLRSAMIWAGARDDMPAVYAALDVVTLTSTGEGLPNAVGEGMACGIVPVVTDVGDCARLVGETGVVVPPGDAKRLAKGWQAVLDLSPTERAERGARARQRIVEQFGRTTLVEATAAALRAVRDGRRPDTP